MSGLIPRLTTGQAQQRLGELEDLLSSDGMVETFVRTDLRIAAANPTGGQVAIPSEIATWREQILARMQDIPAARGDAPRFGAELGRAIDEIVQPIPSDAAHDGVWTFLTLAVLPDLVLKRWGPALHDGVPVLPADRWIGRAAMGGGRDRIYLKTVWRRWRVLGELMLQEQILGEDELVQLFERTAIARNERLVRACAREVLAFEDSNRMDFARELMKRVSYQTGVRLLDLLDDSELAALVSRLADQVRENQTHGTTASPTAINLSQGPEWTPDSVATVLTALDWDSPEQSRVIRHAADHDGRITREDVYRLCGYPPDRMLRGFTRPILRVVRELTERGQIPDGLPVMFEAVPGAGPTQEFRLDDRVSAILRRPASAPGSFGA